MTAIQTRSSLMAVKVESTEGTPVSPTAGTDVLPLENDLALSPSIDELSNDELKNSLGPGKSILGLENPSASFSAYLKASGTAGTAPQGTGELLQAAFGTESLQSTERDTVASSTVSAIKVDSGEGVEWSRGTSVLIKHASNPYELRMIESISTDDLVPLFDCTNAPGTGVNLGKYSAYLPANSAHQTLTLWDYIGNSGGIRMMAGSRVTNIGISIAAGQLINCSYTCEGLEFYYNPIEVTSSDIYLDFTDDNGTFAAVITAQFYKDPKDLASAIQTAMNTVQTAETHTCTYSDTTGKFTIGTSTSAVLSLLWNTGTNTANTVGDVIGFSVAADDTLATSYVADSAIDLSFPYTASFQSSDPLVAKANEVFIGDSTDNSCFAAQSVDINIDTPKTDILSVCANSGKSSSIINAREITVDVVGLLPQYKVDEFHRFQTNQDTRFEFNFGSKTSGNWDEGKCGVFGLLNSTITSWDVSSEDNLAILSFSLKAYVNSDGDAEAALTFH